MNKEYKYNGDKTTVIMDNGEKTVSTIDNMYDVLTLENVIEIISGLKNSEIDNKEKIEKELKTAKKSKALFMLSSIVSAILACSQLILILSNYLLIDLFSLIFFTIVMGYSFYKTNSYSNLNVHLKHKLEKVNNSIEYLSSKENLAITTLQTIKQNSKEIEIKESSNRQLDMDILDIYVKQFESFKRINEIKTDNELVKSYKLTRKK